jgi:hypothetical protein
MAAKSPRKVIEGSVAAQAEGAAIAINDPASAPVQGTAQQEVLVPPTFYFREIIHTRVTHAPTAEGIVRQGVQLIERIPEGGEWPQDLARFQGVGQLNANTPQGPIQRNYRFDVPAVNLEQAWSNFDDAAMRGSANAEREFRVQYQAALRAQADQIAVPTPGQAARILGADGRPLGG